MKRILFLLSFFSCFIAGAQQIPYATDQLYGKQYNRVDAVRALGVPLDTFSIPTARRIHPHYAVKNDVPYIWSIIQQKWIPGGGSGDATGKLNISDTAAMLLNYRHWTQGYLKTYTETDPVFNANGVTLNTAQAITGSKEMNGVFSWRGNSGATVALGQLHYSVVTGGFAGAVSLYNNVNANQGNLLVPLLTGTRNYTFPDKSGTVAMTSDIPAAGITTESDPVFNTNGVKLTGDQTIADIKTFTSNIRSTGFSVRRVDNPTVGLASLTWSLSGANAGGAVVMKALNTSMYGTLSPADNLTNGRLWTLPDKDGIVAMISDIPTGSSTPGIDAVLGVNQALTVNRSIDAGTFSLSLNSNQSQSAFTATNSTGTGIQGTSNGTGVGVRGLSTGGGQAGYFQFQDATTNNIAEVLSISRGSTGAAANGIGAKIVFYNKHSGGFNDFSGSLDNYFTSVTNGSQVSEWDIKGMLSGSQRSYLNAQWNGIVRVNALADTLATKAYVRSIGGSSGNSSMVYPSAGIALSTGSAWGASIVDNSTNWNTAHADRFKWDGGATGLVAATGRTSLGLGTMALQANPVTATGQLLMGGSSNNVEALPANATATKMFLWQNNVQTQWSALVAADIPALNYVVTELDPTALKTTGVQSFSGEKTSSNGFWALAIGAKTGGVTRSELNIITDGGSNIGGTLVLKDQFSVNSGIIKTSGLTAQRFYDLPNEGGTIALREWVTAQGYSTGATKLNISDTSAMLTNYRHWTQGYLNTMPSLQDVTNVDGSTTNDIYIGTGYARTILSPFNIELRGALNEFGYAQIMINRGRDSALGILRFNTAGGSSNWSMGNLPLTSNQPTSDFSLYRNWGGTNDIIYNISTSTGTTTYSSLLKYNANKGSLFDARSLVDKNYVDSVKGTISSSDPNAVKLTGNQTKAGVLTLTSSPIIEGGGAADARVYFSDNNINGGSIGWEEGAEALTIRSINPFSIYQAGAGIPQFQINDSVINIGTPMDLTMRSLRVSGTLEPGLLEFDGTHLYITVNGGGGVSGRHQLDQQSTAGLATKQDLNANLTSISAFTGTAEGFAKRNADGSWILDAGALNISNKLSGLGTVASPLTVNEANFTGIPQSAVTNLITDLGNKQATLVSGTNIKTINGSSILGSGDLVIAGGSGGHTIQDETIALTARANLNFAGAGVTVTDDAANNRTTVNIASGGDVLSTASNTFADAVTQTFNSDITVNATSFVDWKAALYLNEDLLMGSARRIQFRNGANTAYYTALESDAGSSLNFGAPNDINFFANNVFALQAQDNGQMRFPQYTTATTFTAANWGAAVNALAVTADGTIIVTPLGGGGAHTVQDEGVSVTQRGILNFAGAGVTVTDDATNGKTLVTIGGGGSNEFTAAANEGALGYDRVQIGVQAGTPRIIFENAGYTNWMIDNENGTFRWFVPGFERMTLSSAGLLTVGEISTGGELRINTTDQGDYKLQVGGNIWASGTITTPAVTTSTNGLLNVIQGTGTAAKGIIISGDEVYVPNSGNAANGIRISAGVNRGNNKQLWIGDVDNFGSSTLSVFSYYTGNFTSVYAVTGDGLTFKPLNVGAASTGVSIGFDPSDAVNAKLAVKGGLAVGTSSAYFSGTPLTGGALIEGKVMIGRTTEFSVANKFEVEGHSYISGNVRTLGIVTFDGLASGVATPTPSGTEHMLTVDANGLLGHRTIPSGGAGGGDVSSTTSNTFADAVTQTFNSDITVNATSLFTNNTALYQNDNIFMSLGKSVWFRRGDNTSYFEAFTVDGASSMNISAPGGLSLYGNTTQALKVYNTGMLQANQYTTATTFTAANWGAAVNGLAVTSDGTVIVTPLGGGVTPSSTDVFTNKSISLGTNTITSTLAQLNTAVTDADLVSIAGAETLTNKTLTSPVINTPTGITKADVGLSNVDNTSDATQNAATATLTNKTLTSPVINVGADATGDLYYRNASGILTRLPVGAAGQFLTVSAGVPAYAAGSTATDSRITAGTLAADQSNSTTTLTKVTGLDRTLGVGTYQFRYFVRYQSAATTTGVRFSVNHSGTVSFFVANMRWVDVSATASTAAPTQAGVIAAGQVVGAMSANAKSITGWGTTISVPTANSDLLMIIEGTFEVTVAGDIQLYHGSEVAAASTVKAGSNLIITKVN